MANAERIRIRGVSIFRRIIYGNTAVVLSQKERDASTHPDHTHRWTLAVRSAASAPESDQVGGADDLSYFIKRVTFRLHETYPNPSRNVDKPPFEITETGWGEFEVNIRITFIPEAGEKTMALYHHLKLHPWAATGEVEIPPLEVAMKLGPVHSWQYDEIVFNDPFQNFLNILTSHPPTPLPKIKTKPVPFHLANPKSLESSRGGLPEFTTLMEKDEFDRLEEARKKVIEEHTKWHKMLIEKEKEHDKLQTQVVERDREE